MDRAKVIEGLYGISSVEDVERLRGEYKDIVGPVEFIPNHGAMVRLQRIMRPLRKIAEYPPAMAHPDPAVMAAVRKLLQDIEEEVGTPECPVCWEPLSKSTEEDVVLPCGHMLHYLCAAKVPTISWSGCVVHRGMTGPMVPTIDECSGCRGVPRYRRCACPVCRAEFMRGGLRQIFKAD